MRIKEAVKGYFSFGRRDRIGVIAVIVLIGVIYSFPYLFAKRNEPFPANETSVLIKAKDTLAAKQQAYRYETDFGEADKAYPYQPTQTKSFLHAALFRFDPNTLPVEGWQKLGLSEKTSKTIDKYRSKGGKFYKPEDIKKIWGIPDGFYERVKDYIAIVAVHSNYSTNNPEKQVYAKSEKKTVVNINEADTSVFVALPGIGSKLAERIINFREKLGGFYSVDQIRETYGLPDSTFQKIKSSLQLNGPVKKFNINTATKDELKVHPYIKWNLANAIVEYRNQHGQFKSLEELKNISLVDENSYNRILHYLQVN